MNEGNGKKKKMKKWKIGNLGDIWLLNVIKNSTQLVTGFTKQIHLVHQLQMVQVIFCFKGQSYTKKDVDFFMFKEINRIY